MVKKLKHIIFIFCFLLIALSFAQNDCDADVIPCDFPCSEYVIDEDGCPVCECLDGWTPINEDGCYDSSGGTYLPGAEFFINDCEYVICLEVEDGWGGFLDDGIWSEITTIEPCLSDEDNSCIANITIPSNTYNIFNETFNIMNDEVILLPIYKNGDFPISSYQFNINYNPEFVDIALDYLNIVNDSDFYNAYDLNPAISNSYSGGIFSANKTELNNSTALFSIAYATSQVDSVGEILLYIPFYIISPGCFNVNFSNGLINNEYVFPNQTSELLISNQDFYNCSFDGEICINCIDDNENNLCDSQETSGCIDLLACNYNDQATINDDSCIYENECGDCENIGLTQSIDLSFGWSFFSTYICPFKPSIDSIMIELTNNNDIVIVKDDLGNVYWPDFNINGIGDLSNGKGYQIKTVTETTLNIYGDTLNYDHPIIIPDGWSYLGYLHQEPYSIEDMLNAIVENIVIVKDDLGNVYWPNFNINGIDLMSPGKGYQVKTLEEINFSYPQSSNGRYEYNYLPSYFSQFENPKNTGNNMTIGIPEESWERPPNIGDEIIISDTYGLIVGISEYRHEGTVITAWGDDLTTHIKDGLGIGEKLNFQLFRLNENTMESIDIKSWNEGFGNYNIDGISIANSISQNIFEPKKLIKVTDIIGREVNLTTQQTLLYIYTDGSVERKYFLK